MNKHVRQMMVDLRLERQVRYRNCIYRRCLLHTTGTTRYRGKKYHCYRSINYFGRVWFMYAYDRKYNDKTGFVRCSKVVSLKYQYRKHQVWALCNSTVENTIVCAELERVSDPFDRREYIDLAIMELPLHSNN